MSIKTTHKIIEKAHLIATVGHSAVGQLRKYTNEPYITHCENVYSILQQTIDPDAYNLYCILGAGLCHDLLEDSEITFNLLKELIGSCIANLVLEVTNISKPSDGNRKIRKEIDKQHLAIASADAQTIKLADIIDNSLSIIKHDPKFAKVYMAEKEELLKVLKKGNRTLWKQANNIVQEYNGNNSDTIWTTIEKASKEVESWSPLKQTGLVRTQSDA